jgi:hypothetical protein
MYRLAYPLMLLSPQRILSRYRQLPIQSTFYSHIVLVTSRPRLISVIHLYIISQLINQVSFLTAYAVVYASQQLTETQEKWHTKDKEAYAIYHALKTFHPYLSGTKFTVETDHKALEGFPKITENM